MKSKLSTGILCACLFISVIAGYAQEVPQPPPQPPAQQPPAQTPPAQTPPAPPTTAPGTPSAPKPVVQMPPPPAPKPPATHDHDTGGDAFSIEVFGLQTKTSPTIRGGQASIVTDAGDLHFPGNDKIAEGFAITVPTTREDSIEFTFFQAKGQGNTVLGTTQNYFGNDFSVGDTVASNWRVRALKLSWNYLTYPYPSNRAKFRLKTLWEVQYATIASGFDAPADVNAVTTMGTKAVILPTFGLGIEYHPVKRVRLEVKASGFGLYHGADIWDAEGSAVLRLGKIEALAGARLYHYKTSPKSEEFFSQTLGGPYVGIRWVFR